MNFKKAHFIGIAGKGMSATALLLKEAGIAISGSDEGFYPPVSDYLCAAKIAFADGYRKRKHTIRRRCHRHRQECQTGTGQQRRGPCRVRQRKARLLLRRSAGAADRFLGDNSCRGQLRKIDLCRIACLVPDEGRRKIPATSSERLRAASQPTRIAAKVRSSSSKATNILRQTGTTPPNFSTTMRRTCCSRPRRMTTSMSFRHMRIISCHFGHSLHRFRPTAHWSSTVANLMLARSPKAQHV